MKRDRIWILAAVLLALMLALVPNGGSGIFGALALPFTAAGWCLRTLSLSGSLGNAAAIGLYALICAVPLWFWWRGQRRTEDWLLVLLPGVLAVVLYYMVNPNLRSSAMQNEVGDAVYAMSVWSTLVTWGVLKLLFTGAWDLEKNIYRALRIFLLLCAGNCLIQGFGTGTRELMMMLKQNPEAWPGYHRELTVLFLVLNYLVLAVEDGLGALVLYRGAQLLDVLERDPFSEGCVSAAAVVGKTCRDALAIICLSGLTLNLGQLLLSPMLMNIHVSVSFPVMGMAVCFAMLAVTKLLVRGKALKDDNDLFV